MNPLEIPLQVRRQLEGVGPWLDREDREPVDGLVRAIRAAGALRPTFAATVLALLDDEDLTVRSGAVAALPEVAASLPAARLCDVLDRSEGLLRGVQAQGATVLHPDLFHAVLAGLARAAQPGDERALIRLRLAAREQPWASRLLPDLARLDPEWLIAHAREVVPHRSVGVLFSLSPAARLRLVDALAPYPAALRDTLDPGFWGRFSPEEAQTLQHHMWPETPHA